MEYIHINSQSYIPKYRQIILSVHAAIKNGRLKKGDKIPSLNEIKEAYGLSRDTVLTAFKEMKHNKLIVSTPGKGYYISSTNIYQQEKIFLLFDELNAFKEDMYNAFIQEVGQKAAVEIYFHHFNKQVLKNLIEENKFDYTSFVIMPGSISNISASLKKLPAESTYILDRKSNVSDSYGMVIQNFEKDIYNAMKNGNDLLANYQELVLVFPEGKEPQERADGFVNFCKEFDFKHKIIPSLNGQEAKRGEAYFVMNDRHLVSIIKQAEKNKLQIGSDLGVVSFNDTMLKEVVAGGITTISTDFAQMGQKMAQMVMARSKNVIENSAKLIVRNSL